MNKKEIEKLIQNIQGEPDLLETHISYLILTKAYVYKIKKPVSLSFLDFSSLTLRAYYCKKELYLNRRTEPDMYLGVVPVYKWNNQYSFKQEGQIVDYAVKMKRIPANRQMDTMLMQHQVTPHQIKNLAQKVAHFHSTCSVIRDLNWDVAKDYWNDFHDIILHAQPISNLTGADKTQQIQTTCDVVKAFLIDHADQIERRKHLEYLRDVHGDLHSGNIFLTNPPILFDCIEFNDHFRQIDVLNDIGFLLMDMDAHGEAGLEAPFLHSYLHHFPCIRNPFDRALLNYFKAYRANVRAKVISLKSTTVHEENRGGMAKDVGKYLDLMAKYVKGMVQ